MVVEAWRFFSLKIFGVLNLFLFRNYKKTYGIWQITGPNSSPGDGLPNNFPTCLIVLKKTGKTYHGTFFKTISECQSEE